MDQSLCQFVADIQKDPNKIITGLTLRKFTALQAHILVCETCSPIVDDILVKGKDIPSDPNNGWNKTRYN